MSTIISWDVKLGKQRMNIYAPDCRTVITGTDIVDHVIDIEGNTDKPFFIGVRFIDCHIVADNLRAFSRCCFERCEMEVEIMPITLGGQSINSNKVVQTNA